MTAPDVRSPPGPRNRQGHSSNGVQLTDRSREREESSLGRERPELSGLDRNEERRLLERARAGDTRAYGRLVRAHEGRVYGLIYRMVDDAALAEELAQDAFVKAYRGLGSFREDARFGTWIYRIATNLCRDHYDSRTARWDRKRTSLEDLGPAGMDPPASGTRPDEDAERNEMARDFDEAVRALDGKYKEAFLLRHHEDLGYDEISRVLEISRSNAKVRVHRARELVLAALRERGYDV